MEIQGIITGIGNKITPEIDAVINDFVVHSNTLIRGLQLTVYPQHYYLSAGMCQLCGYRGVLLENIDLIAAPYIYGKFVINFDESVPDSFSIFFAYDTNATNDGIVNPGAITQAGVYYLLLYSHGVKEVYDFHYPLWAETAEESYVLFDYGVIAETATTPTAPINDNSRRVANTEYVKKQIVAEIDYQIESISINATNGKSKIIGALVLKKKANYIIGSFNMSETYFYGDYALSGYLGTITNAKLRPKHTAYGVFSFYGNYIQGTSKRLRYWSVRVRLETSGEVYLDETVLAGTKYDEVPLNNSFTATSGLFVFGYDKGE